MRPGSQPRSRGWERARRTRAKITPGLLERGVAIEERLGLLLDYFDSPRCALARQLTHVGEV